MAETPLAKRRAENTGDRGEQVMKVELHFDGAEPPDCLMLYVVSGERRAGRGVHALLRPDVTFPDR